VARCFVTRRLPGDALERLAAEHEIDLWPEDRPPPTEALRRGVEPAEGLLCMLTDRVDSKLIAAAPRLRAISTHAVGTDNIDIAAATAREIPVGNTPDVLTGSTADLAVALMLAIARRLSEGEAIVREGKWGPWSPDFLLGRDLHQATVGIIGPGRIGSEVARRLAGFDTRVLTTGRDAGTPLDELLRQSDFVTLHVPLTDATRGLIGERELRLMKPDAYLINTSRGPLVETEALKRALREGWIGGAALDVTEPEPLPPNHPLLEAPNLLVVPHVGSATERTREAMNSLAVDNLLAGLAGERMPHCVNPEVYGGEG
jgi:glyoxylate reductase